MKSLVIQDDDNWLLFGRFQLLSISRGQKHAGGNIQDTFHFNEAIGHLGLLELLIKGRAYTWGNMQRNPLLEQIDWFFTSVNWTSVYPNTLVLPLSKTTSDHVPCKVVVGTSIPKSQIFRFENFWPDRPGFLDTVKNTWDVEPTKKYGSSIITTKLKSLR
jgi:hypothetical protein